MSGGLGVELCLPTVGVAFAAVRRRSQYCGGMSPIPFRWAVCKKCVREVTRDRVLCDRRIVLSTCRCEGSFFSVARAMDS